MMMRKDYELLAHIMKESHPSTLLKDLSPSALLSRQRQWEDTLVVMCNYLASGGNPRFDEKKFLDACYPERYNPLPSSAQMDDMGTHD